MSNLLSLGFSPCPNDTFIFDAMIHGKIDTEGLRFDPILADVEELNQRAFKRDLDITKLSYHAYAYLFDDYVLLTSGSALGRNCGPLLIARRIPEEATLQQSLIGIPGKYTTANFLLGLAYPEARHKKELLFSEIEGALLAGEIDLGLIIHENRFTYQSKGLKKVLDLGEFWERRYQLPIPLGGIVIRRDFDPALQKKVNRILRRSVAFAFAHPRSSDDFVRTNAQEMEKEVRRQHIELYVNDFTLNLGHRGKKSIHLLFEVARKQGIIPFSEKSLFIPTH